MTSSTGDVAEKGCGFKSHSRRSVGVSDTLGRSDKSSSDKFVLTCILRSRSWSSHLATSLLFFFLSVHFCRPQGCATFT
jgi:hypothetical protein